MGKFDRGDKFGGKKRFDNDRGFRKGGRSDRPAMHQAICSECGKRCEVPFRPTGDKPVYCSTCFGGKEESGNNRFEKRSYDRPNFRDKPMFKATCDKCHKECEVPFRPTGDKPVFCGDCFGKGEKGGRDNKVVSSDQYRKQFEMLNSKLDSIIRLLSPKASVEKEIKDEKPAVEAAKKTAEKKSKEAQVIAPKKTLDSKPAAKKVAKKKALDSKPAAKKAAKKKK